MILIQSIKYIRTPGNIHQIVSEAITRPGQGVPVSSDQGHTVVPATVLIEAVSGQRFVRPDGEDVIIGNSVKAADIIGIQYDSWQEIQQRLEASESSLHEACNRERLLLWQTTHDKEAGFWLRLKWLFTGYTPRNGQPKNG